MSAGDQFYEETVKQLNEKIAQLNSILDQNRTTILSLTLEEKQKLNDLKIKRQTDYPIREMNRKKSFEEFVNQEIERYKSVIFWICAYGFDPSKLLDRSPSSFNGIVFFIGNYNTMTQSLKVLTDAKKTNGGEPNNSEEQLKTVVAMMNTYDKKKLNVERYGYLDYSNKLDVFSEWETFVCFDYRLLGKKTMVLDNTWAYYNETITNGADLTKTKVFNTPLPTNDLIPLAVCSTMLPFNKMSYVTKPYGIFLIGDNYLTNVKLSITNWLLDHVSSIVDSIFPFIDDGKEVMIFNGHSGYSYASDVIMGPILDVSTYVQYPKTLLNSDVLVEITKELIRRGASKYINSIRILNLTS